MRTIVQKTIIHETKRHDFDNEFAYIEVWQNNHLKDCYFAEKDLLFPDGTIKKDGKKYFYSPFSGEEICKEVKQINLNFKWFDKLYYFDDEGNIFRIDGTPSADVDYNLD